MSTRDMTASLGLGFIALAILGMKFEIQSPAYLGVGILATHLVMIEIAAHITNFYDAIIKIGKFNLIDNIGIKIVYRLNKFVTQTSQFSIPIAITIPIYLANNFSKTLVGKVTDLTTLFSMGLTIIYIALLNRKN
ncbi:hypothetical protein [Pontibacillus salipaludis]|uniref:Uncharacterized protein n=1 Tax=Pontibacillus salipaludis TaxID=1697394 RepID=A0ABQ1PVR5_9BACI|nr:hypothetical protein [Pontibacillus salipaludis]GGD05311.1 hypothetical protein GCM10011389_11020 [Pontibacillus salipaludis]